MGIGFLMFVQNAPDGFIAQDIHVIPFIVIV
jgi:hypothetical protein